MSASTTQSTLVEAGLRAEIRLLGQLLGETLREHEGLPLYELEESIRLRTKALRQQYDAADEAGLVAELGQLPLEDAARLVRAFATYFQLVNLAELELQARSVQESGDESAGLDRLLAACAAQQKGSQFLTQLGQIAVDIRDLRRLRRCAQCGLQGLDLSAFAGSTERIDPLNFRAQVESLKPGVINLDRSSNGGFRGRAGNPHVGSQRAST